MRNNPNEMRNSWKHCVHSAIWVSFGHPRHGKRKETLRAASRLPLRMLQRKGNRASINIVVKMCLSLNSEIPALKCWLHQLPSRENLRNDFDPANLIEILSCVFSSPKTPAKKCSSRTRATSKDIYIYICFAFCHRKWKRANSKNSGKSLVWLCSSFLAWPPLASNNKE